MSKKRILFVCTGNSCRSQMAEGLVNHFLGDHYEAFSAGIMPVRVDPRAVTVMTELGIDISGQKHKHIDELPDINFDKIITLCSDADKRCLVYIGDQGNGKRVHIGFSDPIKAKGTKEEVLEEFRSVREQIREKVLNYLENLDT